nr:heparan-alpha-glucosaminide N-acetyltransferase domain-containing protein [uncultured Roseateles sp.]
MSAPVAVTIPAARAASSRIASIDALRGVVMIVMLLDHVRETFFLHLQVTDPMTVPGTPPALFFSRLAAHLCAPVFVFLTGLSAWLYAHPDGAPPRDVRGFLLKRGLLLIGLELTLVNFAWSASFGVIYLQVIWAIGLSMLALALLSGLPRWALVGIGLVIVGGHNALTGLSVPPDGGWRALWALWTLMLHRDWLIPEGLVRVRVSYPALPWIGVILLGFAMGPLFARAADAWRRRRVLCGLAAACLFALLVLRGFNLYGENAPWVTGATALDTAMSFLNFTKYPPSLDFLLLTLGIGLALLAALERWRNAFTRACAVFGGAPMFFYLLHLYVLLIGYRVLLAIFGPNQGLRFGVDAGQFPLIWLIWLGLVPLLYPPVKAFAAYKRRTHRAWVKYL